MIDINKDKCNKWRWVTIPLGSDGQPLSIPYSIPCSLTHRDNHDCSIKNAHFHTFWLDHREPIDVRTNELTDNTSFRVACLQQIRQPDQDLQKTGTDTNTDGNIRHDNWQTEICFVLCKLYGICIWQLQKTWERSIQYDFISRKKTRGAAIKTMVKNAYFFLLIFST